jgi:hypothetical protein
MKNLLMVILFSTLLAACKGGGEGVEAAKNVTVNTANVYVPIDIKAYPLGPGAPFTSAKAEGVLDLDEYLFDSGEYLVKVIVKNNTDFPMENMNVVYPGQSGDTFGFEKDDQGVSEYPGDSGTCTDKLMPKQTCMVMLAFDINSAVGPGQITQNVTLQYTNLIEPDNTSFALSIYAGFEAKLNYQNFETMFYFGSKVGLAQKPVLERSEKVTYHKELTVTNDGDLRARNINVLQGVSCESVFTGTACDSAIVDGSWWYEHDCPAELNGGDSCTVDVYFQPLNQNPPVGPVPDEIKEVRYDSTALVEYKKNPALQNGALNGYFTTFSTTVAARFETGIDSLIFDTVIINGNRESKIFKTDNNGYVDGELQWLNFYDVVSGDHMASCRKTVSDADYLKCFDETRTVELTLEDFPFFLKDRDGCMADTVSAAVLTPVDDGCTFDLFFQPSLNFATAKTFQLDLKAEYDNRWKGIVNNIEENWLHEVESESINQAKLIVTNLEYEGKDFTALPASTSPDAQYDLGRLALMNAGLYTRKSIKVTFKNVGGVEVNVSQFKDGSNNLIPKSNDNPTGVDIGATTPVYYEGAIVNSSSCDVIPPDGECSIQTEFAPIFFDNTTTELANMFDYVDADPLLNYKSFLVDYEDQSLYTDTNLYTTTKDVPNREAKAQIFAYLIKKGYMKQYEDASMPEVILGNIVTGSTVLQNIGTGNIEYIPYNHPDAHEDIPDTFDIIDRLMGEVNARNPHRIVAADSDLMTSESADYDCRDVIDFDYLDVDTLTDINNRSADWSLLAPGEKCVLTYQMQQNDYFYATSAALLGLNPKGGELARKFTLSEFPGKEAHMLNPTCPGNNGCGHNIVIDYFDGDITDPDAVGAFGTDFGNHVRTNRNNSDFPLAHINNKRTAVNLKMPGYVIVQGAAPSYSAVLYRPGFTLPQVMINTVEHLPQTDIAEQWWWSEYNKQGDDISKEYLSAYHSLSEVATDVSDHVSGHEHVVHLGTFPVGQGAFKGKFKLNNPSDSNAILVKEVLSGDTQFAHTSSITYGTPATYVTLAPTAAITDTTKTIGHNVEIDFTPTADQTYTASFAYTYQNGLFTNQIDDTAGMVEKVQKVRLIARGLVDAPRLGMEVAAYEITPKLDENEAATEGPLDGSDEFDEDLVKASVTPGYNDTDGETVTFESIKIANPGINDFYVKKRIRFTNLSGTYPIKNLKFHIKNNLDDDDKTDITDTQVTLDKTDCYDTLAGNGGQLDANGGLKDTCYWEIKYQPNDNSTSADYYLVAHYEIADNQWIQQNILLDFIAKSPANLAATNRQSTPAFGENGQNLGFIYKLEFGNIELTSDYQEIASTNVIIENSSETTRGSLVRAWQLHNGISDKTVLPSIGDYTNDFIEIKRTTYSGGATRIKVDASRGCIVGDDEVGLEDHEKGFYKDTSNGCILNFYLYANVNYSGVTIGSNTPETIGGNYITLEYYNNERASFDDVNLTFYFDGTVNPNKSMGNTTGYANVTSIDSKEIHFEWDIMTPGNSDLGPIVGYRVFRSTGPAGLGDVLNNPLNYEDVMGASNRSYTISTDLIARQFYYFTVAAIRSHPDYDADAFENLTGMYVSPTDMQVVRIPVPPSGYFYDHGMKVMAERTASSMSLMNFSQAQSHCSNKSKLTMFDSGGFPFYSYNLIDDSVWGLIMSDPGNSTYSEINITPHWLDGATYNITSELTGFNNFDPMASSGFADNGGQNYFFVRDGSDPDAEVPKFVGGFGAGNPDTIGFVDGAINFGVPRCYIDVTN